MTLICFFIGHKYTKYLKYINDEVKPADNVNEEIWKSVGSSFYCKRCFDQRMYHLNFTRTKKYPLQPEMPK